MKISSKVRWLEIRIISLYMPFCGALSWSVHDHTIWPMILSSCCYSLKLFSYSPDHQDKLAFIWSLSLISVSRPFLSLSALGDLLFSSPRPFDLSLWALVFTPQKGDWQRQGEKTHCFQILLCCPFSTDICVIICVIITPLNLLAMLLLSYQLFEFRREKPQAHWNVMLSHASCLPVTTETAWPAY